MFAEPERPERPWEADRPLTTEIVRSAIEAQFPDVDLSAVERLGSGWEFDAYLTGDGWVFRFPRREEHAAAFEQEARVHEIVRPALAPVEIPRVELRGEPGRHFPYEFRGHRLVPGAAADDPGVRAERLAPQIGRTLGRLHAIPPAAATAAGVERCEEDCADWLEETLEIAPALRRLPIVRPALDWLEGQDRAPTAYAGPPRLLHDDLCPDHLLVDRDSSRLVGILDWTDATLGDPALDFTVLLAWQGPEFVDTALRAYDGSLDAAFRERLRFLARVGSLAWLHEAVERRTNVARHVEWVQNAFRGPARPAGA